MVDACSALRNSNSTLVFRSPLWPRIANLGHLKQLTWLDLSFNNIRLSTHPVGLSRSAKVSWVYQPHDGILSQMVHGLTISRPKGPNPQHASNSLSTCHGFPLFGMAQQHPTTPKESRCTWTRRAPQGLKNLKSRWSNDVKWLLSPQPRATHFEEKSKAWESYMNFWSLGRLVRGHNDTGRPILLVIISRYLK
jgi:hypothetical protein